MAARRKFWSVLLKIAEGVMTAALLAAVGFLLVMAQPQPDEKEPAAPQPLLTASPAVTITSEAEMRKLAESFPVPVMSFMSTGGMQFVSASSADVAYGGGFGRIATLYWQTPDGEPLILQSIYPAEALSLMETGYHFSNTAGPSLFGFDSVKMENADTVRIHAATDTGLYLMIVPRSLAPKITTLSRSLQLISVSR